MICIGASESMFMVVTAYVLKRTFRCKKRLVIHSDRIPIEIVTMDVPADPIDRCHCRHTNDALLVSRC
jgi:hypothetical protein